MATSRLKVKETVVVKLEDFQGLFDALKKMGYTAVGPTVSDGAIVYDKLESVADLPRGLTDEQDGGTYRLKPRQDDALFGYNVGPHSWKKFLFPPTQKLWSARSNGKAFEIVDNKKPAPKYAFLGVRACELHAIAVQDKVFLEGDHVDPGYRSRRDKALLIAVNCGQAGGTCFCVSMNTGPRAESGYDLVITEVMERKRHEFVIEAGSEQGAKVLSRVMYTRATDKDKQSVAHTIDRTVEQMGRSMNTTDIQSLLQNNYEHPRWKDVAERCLTCANCTMACPTCFCSTVEDVTDLTGEHAERWRRWDSCFTMDFSYMNQAHTRASTQARYRQWMTHKLSSWFDQFGSSGCVGCGRCITWCPVGIDITEEVRAIRGNPPEATDNENKEKP